MENSLQARRRASGSGVFYILLLFVSFIWLNIFATSNSIINSFFVGYGNLLDTSNANTAFIVSSIVVGAIFDVVFFEILFYIYRLVISRSVYTYVVPADKIKEESRTFMVYRNIFLGVFYNLCFLYPFLYMYAGLMSLVITVIVVIFYGIHLANRYSQSITKHFVYRNFILPIFIYEAISLIFTLLGGL